MMDCLDLEFEPERPTERGLTGQRRKPGRRVWGVLTDFNRKTGHSEPQNVLKKKKKKKKSSRGAHCIRHLFVILPHESHFIIYFWVLHPTQLSGSAPRAARRLPVSYTSLVYVTLTS